MAEENQVASKSLSASIGKFFRGKRPTGSPTGRRRQKELSLGGRPRSKSFEGSLETQRAQTDDSIETLPSHAGWKELSLVRSLTPVVACILPAVALDFVTSSLLAIGATPVVIEDAEDMEQHLQNCKAVVVDVSASKDLVEALMEHYIPTQTPLILVTWGAGTSDRKKRLARQVTEKCEPTVISGRMGDISALAMDVMDRATGMLSDEDEEEHKRACASSPSITITNPSGHPPPRGSPQLIRKKRNAPVQRKGTVLPTVVKKGQFRDRSMKEVAPTIALDMAGKLAAQSGCYVHLYETNTLTSGEFILEINNTQLGMQYLHSSVQCAGSILAAVLACVDEQGDTITLQHCGHALSLFHVAAEEAGIAATEGSSGITPGKLRVEFIDCLHCLDVVEVKQKAIILVHNI